MSNNQKDTFPTLDVEIKKRSGYKKTKLGWIPENWTIDEVGNNIQVSKKRFNPKINEESRKCVELENINKSVGTINGYFDSQNQKSIKAVFEMGDTLFGKLRPNLRKFWQAEFDGVCSTEIWVMNAIDDKMEKAFLIQFIQQEKFYQISIVTSGSKMPRANWSFIKNFPMLFPPLNEQKAIANCLSTWDTAITKLNTLVTTKEKQKKALMQQLLSGKKRLTGFDREWVSNRFDHFLNYTPRPVQKPDTSFTKLGIRSHCKGTFQNKDFEPEKIAIDTLYLVNPNDLIVNITFAWEGAIAIVKDEDEGALVSHRFPTYSFIEGISDSAFFKQFIQSKRFRYLLDIISPGGAGRNRVLSKKELNKLKIKIPSYDEQMSIGEVLGSADKEIELLNKQLTQLKKQKKGLMQQLLTGKKRLKF